MKTCFLFLPISSRVFFTPGCCVADTCYLSYIKSDLFNEVTSEGDMLKFYEEATLDDT